MQILRPHLRLKNQVCWGWGLAICAVRSLPGDPDAYSSLRTNGLCDFQGCPESPSRGSGQKRLGEERRMLKGTFIAAGLNNAHRVFHNNKRQPQCKVQLGPLGYMLLYATKRILCQGLALWACDLHSLTGPHPWKGPMFGLMLCNGCLENMNSFGTGSHAFSFRTGSCKLYSQPCPCPSSCKWGTVFGRGRRFGETGGGITRPCHASRAWSRKAALPQIQGGAPGAG